MSRQVLIINVTRMGDVVQMGTLLARLQEEWPGCAVDLVVDRKFAAVASLMTGLREVLAFDFQAVIDESRVAAKSVVALYQEVAAWAGPLAARRYDRVINLTFNRPSALLSRYIGAPDIRGARIAWDGGTTIENGWMGYFTDMHRFRMMNRFNLVDVYALGGSGPGAFAPLSVRVTPEARGWAQTFLAADGATAREWVAVQAGASDVMKAWRPQYFGQVMARVSRRWSGGFVMIGTAAEQETIAQALRAYREAGGQQPVRNAAGHTTVEQLTGLLASCRVLLTNDTGPMHLAVGVRTPVIDLSVGHVDFQETGPHGPGHWVVQPDLECAPCGFDRVCGHQTCKDRVPVSMVAQLIGHVLGREAAPATDAGVRLYRSDVDEDQLGTFRLVGRAESSDIEWYAHWWRRYWYELLTGQPSRLPSLAGGPSDASSVAEQINDLLPTMEGLCQRAEALVHAVMASPMPVSRVRQLQQEQTRAREQMMQQSEGSLAMAPLTAVVMRQLHNDEIRGLEGMARYHADVYRRWRGQLMDVYQALRGCLPDKRPRPLPLWRPSGASIAARTV